MKKIYNIKNITLEIDTFDPVGSPGLININKYLTLTKC